MDEIAAHLAAGENVTLLYGAKDPEINQARVLCDWLHTVSNKTAK
jgi:transcriptional regulator, MarR family